MIIDEKSTSDVLKQYQELGFDLTKPMIIEFFIGGSQKNLQSIESQHRKPTHFLSARFSNQY